MKVYLLHSSEGEYSSRTERIEGAWLAPEKPQAECDKNNAAYREHLNHESDWLRKIEAMRPEFGSEAYAEMLESQPEWSGPEYFWVSEIEVEE